MGGSQGLKEEREAIDVTFLLVMYRGVLGLAWNVWFVKGNINLFPLLLI